MARQTPAPTPYALPGADLSDVLVIHYDDTITYQPGKLNTVQAGLKLSQGLQAKVIARTGQPVTYKNGKTSKLPFHGRPDAGDCIPDTRGNNKGGWIYVSNSEMRPRDANGEKGHGGVGAITFDKQGKPISYDMLLTNTTWNCGGGLTPWNTWVSCEEQPNGRVYQVDPLGLRPPQMMTMGREGGSWESFTYDLLNMSEPHFYLTEDAPRGAVQRFTPKRALWNKNSWRMLHRTGKTEYLKLIPNKEMTGGKYRWINDRVAGRNNAFEYYPNVEGIDSDGDSVYFVSKRFQQLYELNLRDGTYTNSSTVRGKFNGKPDQVAKVLANGNNVKHKDDLLYFTEESRRRAGVHGRNPGGKYVTIFESEAYNGECAGLAFSPDGTALMIAYQDAGVLLQVTRKDGFPFHAKSLNIKYHKETNNDAAASGRSIGDDDGGIYIGEDDDGWV